MPVADATMLALGTANLFAAGPGLPGLGLAILLQCDAAMCLLPVCVLTISNEVVRSIGVS